MFIEKKLDLFIEKIPRRKIIDDTVLATKANPEQISRILDTFINETRVCLNLIKEYLSPQLHILEVGAGLCLFSLFLKEQGYVITALEPSAGGFELFDKMKKIILNHYNFLSLTTLEIKAENLTKNNGKYDLIFSSNVIEHIPDFPSAFDSMLNVLGPNGKMVHGCPNYIIPYEPHLGIPVVKSMKKISELIFKKKIMQRKDLWDSLNFVTYFSVRNYAKKNKLNYGFKKKMLYEAFIRIDKDTEFRKRHAKGMFTFIYFFLKYSGLVGLLKYLPAVLSTPMIFELNRRE